MSTATMDQALAGSPDKLGDVLLGLAEDQWFDRKSARVKPLLPACLSETGSGC